VAFRTLGTGIRLRDFCLIAGGYFVCGATNGLIGIHLIPDCVRPMDWASGCMIFK
jgi:hypothetical protein